MFRCLPLLLALWLLTDAKAVGQRIAPKATHCATDIRLQKKLKENRTFQKKYLEERQAFARLAGAGQKMKTIFKPNGTVYTIPVVFHIVMQHPDSVSDLQVLSQVAMLNQAFAGTNDQSALPAAFQSLASGTSIQFCLAQKAPDGLPTNAIIRHTANTASFSATQDYIKESVSGGANPWNTNQYLNIWVGNLQDGILGYASYPNEGDSAHQGIVISPLTLPNPAGGTYSLGKTLVHETGHFFNLFHIWGDDDGACSGTDDVNDTPNQADATYGFPGGLVTDACSPLAPGIMYQNFMDYSDDSAMLLFTIDQSARMNLALTTYRIALAASTTCQPPLLKNHDLELLELQDYSERVCTATLQPVLQVRNRGTQTITSIGFHYRLGTGTWQTYNYTGTINSLDVQFIPLPEIQLPPGHSEFEAYAGQSNGSPDEFPGNDSLKRPYQYFPAVTEAFMESFEGESFSPAGWDILNPDQLVGWERNTDAGFTGLASMRLRSFDYDRVGQFDLLRLPQLLMKESDSCFLSFELAAATFSDVNGSNTVWDTLEVLVSSDCGKTYTSVYKKWGKTLVTVTQPVTNFFIPGQGDWRKDSVDISAFTRQGEVIVAFRNTAGFENNIYIDDVKLRLVNVSATLRVRGILIQPNPTTGLFTLRFYPHPEKLRSIQLFDARGAMLSKKDIALGAAENNYYFDISHHPPGIYFLRAVFEDRIQVLKIIRQ